MSHEHPEFPTEQEVPSSTEHSEKLEVSEADKQYIEHIEHLQCSDDLKVQIILTLLGAKPASTFGLTNKDDAPEKIAEVLQSVGLFVELEKRGQTSNIIVARSPNTIQAILQLHAQVAEKGYPQNYHEKYGQLVGYPQTAIDAFTGRIPAFSEEESYQLDPDSIYSILFSKEHWKEESKTMRQWSELIKSYAPNLWEKVHQKRIKQLSRKK